MTFCGTGRSRLIPGCRCGGFLRSVTGNIVNGTKYCFQTIEGLLFFGPIMGSGNYLACFTRFICLFIFFLMVIVNKQTYVFKN